MRKGTLRTKDEYDKVMFAARFSGLDVPCPGCGCNLRDNRAERCPGCDMYLPDSMLFAFYAEPPKSWISHWAVKLLFWAGLVIAVVMFLVYSLYSALDEGIMFGVG